MLSMTFQVLIFSTMTRALDILEGYLDWRGWQCARLDGATPTAERGSIIASFNDPKRDINIFLLSVRAGGVGLNLQFADTVIMYDTGGRPHSSNATKTSSAVIVHRTVTHTSSHPELQWHVPYCVHSMPAFACLRYKKSVGVLDSSMCYRSR